MFQSPIQTIYMYSRVYISYIVLNSLETTAPTFNGSSGLDQRPASWLCSRSSHIRHNNQPKHASDSHRRSKNSREEGNLRIGNVRGVGRMVKAFRLFSAPVSLPRFVGKFSDFYVGLPGPTFYSASSFFFGRGLLPATFHHDDGVGFLRPSPRGADAIPCK